MMCIGLFGHSAVFHNATSAIYLYGGYVVTAESAGLSNDLYNVQLIKRQDGIYGVWWKRIRSTDNNQVTVQFVTLFSFQFFIASVISL